MSSTFSEALNYEPASSPGGGQGEVSHTGFFTPSPPNPLSGRGGNEVSFVIQSSEE